MKCTNYIELDNLSNMIPSGTPNGWLYIGDENVRYLLGEPKKKNILIFGVNPSTATPNKPDRTITKVRNICHNQDSDCGWIMANLYPFRTPHPQDLPMKCNSMLSDNNIHILKILLSQYNIVKVWAAWGNTIDSREYLPEELLNLKKIFDSKNELLWYHVSPMTKSGNPHHPLYLKNDSLLELFDISQYICKYNHTQ